MAHEQDVTFSKAAYGTLAHGKILEDFLKGIAKQ